MSILNESKQLVKLSWPILIAQLSLASLGVIDTIMAGQVSTDDLAAIGLGSSILFPVMMLAVGLLITITTLVAKQFGKKDFRQMEVFFQQGIWLSIPLGIITFFLLINSSWVLNLLPLTDKVFQLSNDYLFYIAFGLPALSVYFVFRYFWEAIGLTLPTMWISLLTILINVPLNAIFIYGWGGVDAYGASGCGIASAITIWLILIVAIVYALLSKKITPYLNLKPSNFKFPIWKGGIQNILLLGIPNTFAILFEVSLFSFIGLFIAVLGTKVIASQQIGVSYTSLLFMLPLSISMAITIRVSQAYGKSQKKEVYNRIYSGLLMSLIAGIFLAVFTYFLKEPITKLFTDDVEVFKLAVGLLGIAAIYQVFDSIQASCSGALRGLHNTNIIMWVTFVCFWGIGLGIGYLFAFTPVFFEPMGVKGFWYSIVIGFFVATIILLSKLFSLLKKLEQRGEIL